MKKGFALALIVSSLPACAALQSPEPGTQTGATMRALVNQLVGNYNNYAQIWYARQANDTIAPPPPARIEIQPIVGAQGRPAYLRFSHYRADAGAEELVRQVRWEFRPDAEEGAVIQSVYLHQNGGWRMLAGCEVYWRGTDLGFRGQTRGTGCRYRDQATDGVVVFQRRFDLGQAGLSYRFTRTGAGQPETTVLQLARIVVYTGWAGVRENEADDGSWRLDDDVQVHNQGGMARLVDNRGVPLGYGVKLEQLVWPDSKIPMLRLSIVNWSDGETLAYVWAEPDAKRLGLNLGWLQVGLER